MRYLLLVGVVAGAWLAWTWWHSPAQPNAGSGQPAGLFETASKEITEQIERLRAAGEPPKAYFKYVDDGGSLRFVERFEEIPPHLRARARSVAMNRLSTMPTEDDKDSKGAASPANGPAGGFLRLFSDEAQPVAAKQATHNVVVYTTKWCGWCRKTLAHLDGQGVQYLNKDIEEDKEAAAELRQKTGSASIPVVEIDGELVRGFDPARIDQLLARTS